MREHKVLSTAFLTVAATGAGLGILPAVAGAQEAPPAAALSDKDVTNIVIATPSDANIEQFLERALVHTQEPMIVRQSIQQMAVPAGTPAAHINQNMRNELTDLIYRNQTIYQTSAATAAEAESRGIQGSLAAHFDGCKPDATEGVTFDEAEASMDCMRQERRYAPVKKGAALAVGAAAAGVGASVLVNAGARKRREHQRMRR